MTQSVEVGWEMAISLYDATASGYIQTLGAVAGFLEKARGYCRATGLDPEALVESRIHPGMRPLRFQIVSVVHHSQGAIEGVKVGRFAPPPDRGPLNFESLHALVVDARSAIEQLDPGQVNDLQGRDVVFEVRDFKREFTVEGFLLSFSIPNFHFHATTAYDILRSHGVPIGKGDYLGHLRLKS